MEPLFLIAFLGQTCIHWPQPIQTLGSILAFFSITTIAPTGHFLAQIPQPTHFSSFTTGTRRHIFLRPVTPKRRHLHPFFPLHPFPQPLPHLDIIFSPFTKDFCADAY